MFFFYKKTKNAQSPPRTRKKYKSKNGPGKKILYGSVIAAVILILASI